MPAPRLPHDEELEPLVVRLEQVLTQLEATTDELRRLFQYRARRLGLAEQGGESDRRVPDGRDNRG